MLKKGTKYLITWLTLLSVSCSDNVKTKNVTSSVLENNFVKNNFIYYKEIYGTITDSIEYYKKEQLFGFLNIYKEYWIVDSVEYLQIDSMLCINSSNDKLVTTMNISLGVCHDCSMDQVSKILGKKINGKWHFFEGGGTLVVPRDMYGKDAMHPLNFYELSQIARKEMLAGAIIEKNGKLIIDDNWIDNHFYYHGMCAHCNTKAEYDSAHWSKITGKWKHKLDTNEYKPLQRKQFKKVNS